MDLLFDSDVVNPPLKTSWGETRSDFFCFCSLECFNCRRVGGGSMKRKHLFRAGWDFLRIVVGRFKCGKMGWPSKFFMKFFMDNSFETLIPFNERHQGLLKLHVPLGLGRVPVWGIWGYLQKRKFSLKRRNDVWGGFSGPTEKNFLQRIWRGPIKKNGDNTERRGSIAKFGDTLFEGFWKSCGTLHVWWSYGNFIYQKVGPSWDVRLLTY